MDELQKLQERVVNPKSLHFNRVPRKTKEEFLALAESDFEGDRGMLLKWLMDGLVKADIAMVLQELEDLKVRVGQLEQRPQPETLKGVKMLSGKRIGGTIR